MCAPEARHMHSSFENGNTITNMYHMHSNSKSTGQQQEEKQQLSNSLDRSYYVARGQKY